MTFWLFMFVMDLLVPVAMIAAGLLFIKKPPKNINRVFGYRTPMSMHNNDTWAFAHNYCGRLWLRCGAPLLAVSAAVLLSLRGRDDGTVGLWGAVICLAQCAVMILPIIPTEAALRRNFDREGNRRV